MTHLNSPSDLKSIIQQEAWQELLGVDPDKIALALSFDDNMRLVNSLFVSGELYESTGYSVRLLCALKRFYSLDWYHSWRYEAFLGTIYCFGNMEEERFYAFDRARRMVSPLPGALAIELANCIHMPGKQLVSASEAFELYEHALREYPYVRALYGLRSFYQEMGGKEAEIEEINKTLKKRPEGELRQLQLADPDVCPDCLSDPLAFDKPTSNIDVSFYNASTPEVWEWVRSHKWDKLADVDPRRVVDRLSFNDALRACYRMLQASPQAQDYAIRILYALRWGFYELWMKDWHCDALLGYACELTRRYEEQVSGYLQAAHHIRELPHELAIATARSHFVPQPAISAPKAIEMLQNVIKEKKYVDALLLLKRLYRSTCQNEEASEVDRILANLKDSGCYAPSILPICVTEPYENLEA